MRFIASLFSFLSVALILLVAVGIGALVYFSRDLPDYTVLKNYHPSILSRIYAGDGRLMATIASEQRVFVPVEAMPNQLIQAFISAEDKDFFTHSGIDPNGVLRAMLMNLRHIKDDKRPVGASTITQQVAKNFLLTNEVSVTRKIREALLAMRIEQTLSKKQILELYLNEIFLGYRSYGVAAAAQNYFNKSLNELDLAESAYLASLPKGPNNYHPINRKEAALERRNWVLDRMAEEGYIRQEQAENAKKEDLIVRNRSEAEVVESDYFSEEVRRLLVQGYGEEKVLSEGLAVRTSLNPAYQALAEKALRQGLMDFDRRKRGWRGPLAKFDLASGMSWALLLKHVDVPKGGEIWKKAMVLSISKGQAILGFEDGSKGRLAETSYAWTKNNLAPGYAVLVEPLADEVVDDEEKAEADKTNKQTIYAIRQVPTVQGAIVVMDPHTGRVFAMQGGFSMRISDFNRATQAYRQPGSAFKPFVYLAALDNKFTPSSLVLDAPFAISQGPGLPLWQPENYDEDYLGPTTLRVGLEKSRNIMTVRLAHAVGMEKIKEYAERFGIVDDMPTYLSFALGAKETTPLRLATAYAMLVNGGKQVRPSLIDRIQDRDGKTIWQRDRQKCSDCSALGWSPDLQPPELPDTRQQIADPRTIYQIVDILEGVCQRGTAARLSALGFPVAGKTGTTNESRDAWFMGFTPDLVVGVWVGYDEPRPLGGRETGATVAVPIFQNFMAAVMKDKPATPFRVPSGLKLVRVDLQTGRPADDSTTKAIWEPFIPGTEPDEYSPSVVLDGSGEVSGNTDGGGEISMPETAAPVTMQGTGGLY